MREVVGGVGGADRVARDVAAEAAPLGEELLEEGGAEAA